ncbi:hypothetical protein B0H10DRAFT_1955189 [Mycena sp. CBHHK59/15]|nr:hypothetical protein B0H10DRAFT_1955189 [Mycena sp. CBHHK59/15]
MSLQYGHQATGGQSVGSYGIVFCFQTIPSDVPEKSGQKVLGQQRRIDVSNSLDCHRVQIVRLIPVDTWRSRGRASLPVCGTLAPRYSTNKKQNKYHWITGRFKSKLVVVELGVHISSHDKSILDDINVLHPRGSRNPKWDIQRLFMGTSVAAT